MDLGQDWIFPELGDGKSNRKTDKDYEAIQRSWDAEHPTVHYEGEKQDVEDVDCHHKLPYRTCSSFCRNEPEWFGEEARFALGTEPRIELNLSDFIFTSTHWAFSFHIYSERLP